MAIQENNLVAFKLTELLMDRQVFRDAEVHRSCIGESCHVQWGQLLLRWIRQLYGGTNQTHERVICYELPSAYRNWLPVREALEN